MGVSDRRCGEPPMGLVDGMLKKKRRPRDLGSTEPERLSYV